MQHGARSTGSRERTQSSYLDAAPQPEKTWSGRIRFDQDTVIRTPVKETAGTEIRLERIGK